MKTYTGTVVGAIADSSAPNVTIAVPGACITMHCGSRVAAEASALIGRKVKFQAELSERTQCLTDVQLCVRSEYGLRAVKADAVDTRSSGVRECPASVRAQALDGHRPGWR